MEDFKKTLGQIMFYSGGTKRPNFQKQEAMFKACIAEMIEKCAPKMSLVDVAELIFALSVERADTHESLCACLNSLGRKIEDLKEGGVEQPSKKVLYPLDMAYHEYVRKIMVPSAMRILSFIQKYDPDGTTISGAGV